MEKLQAEMAAKGQAERDEMEEFERVRNELYEEEMKEKLRQEGLREVELKIRNKLELQAEEAEALMIKKRLAEEEARDEEEFRVAMMEKFSRDDRLEQMNAARRRMKVQEHKRAVLALIEEREQRRAFEKQQEMTEFETSKAREAARRQIVEEERQK